MPHRANLLLSKFHLLITSLLPYPIVSFCLPSCSRPAHNDSFSLTFLIEASPTNLDPRLATDSQSQRIDGLLFSGLLEARARQSNVFPRRSCRILVNSRRAHLRLPSSQEQWGRVGIQLELRPLELATLFSYVAKGNCQITYQRWGWRQHRSGLF